MNMQSSLQALLDADVYAPKQADKQALLLDRLNALTEFHYHACAEYRQIIDAFGWPRHAATYADLPYLAVRLFKHRSLRSVPAEAIFKTLSSSGTTGPVSRIALDRETSALQSKVLVKIMQTVIGKQRLPMLLVEQPTLIQNRADFSARGAGALGLSFLGRDHHYALDANMQPDWPAIETFCERYADQSVLIFGFTYMVWQFLLQPLQQRGIRLPLSNGILFHSGGWKKLQHLAVDSAAFNRVCGERLGLNQVHNFYGMAEQTGSIFVSCEHNHLHAPVMAEVVIRDMRTLEILEHGQTGLVQVLSALPQSYPGHSLLTEDLGTCLGEDDCPCGRSGRYFIIHGRTATAEARGCSDTFR